MATVDHAPTGELLTPKQAAKHVGEALHGQPYKVRTIYNLRSKGVLPAPDEIRRGRPRWYRSTLDAWVATQIQRPATAARRQSKKPKSKR